MTQVVVGENEGIESALRRFKRQVSKADIFADMKKNRHFKICSNLSERNPINPPKLNYLILRYCDFTL